MKRTSRSTLFGAVFLSVFLGLLCFQASAQVPFVWNAINVDMDVQANGDIWVTEQQEYSFTDQYSNQRYRYIPLSKVDEIRDVTVQEKEQPLPTQTGIENNQFWIRWEHPLKAPEVHTFVIKYRVLGGYQIAGQNTQIYWKAIFADRKAPVKKAKVQVRVPEALSGKISSFTSFGTPATTRQINPRTVEFTATQVIQPKEELEIQLNFPTATLNWPQPQWPSSDQSSAWGLMAFIAFIAVSFLLLIGAVISAISGDSRSGRSGGGSFGGGGGGGGG